MYQHHVESIENMKKYFEKMGAIALILGGSVAKGNERPDSDLDGMVILTEEAYEELAKGNATTDCIHGHCTYEGGYFDIKYMTKSYLRDLAERGSEPARNGFRSSKILFNQDKEIEEILPRIPVFQTKEKEEKLLSFYSDFWLNYYYFLKSCNIEGYMRMRTIAEIIYALYRILLQEAEILFDCNRRLEEQVKAISEETAQLVMIGHQLEKSQSLEDADAFVNKYYEISTYRGPGDMAAVFTTYSKDFQEWWREQRPNINEW